MNRFAATTALLLFASAGFSQITSEHLVSTPVFGPATVHGSAIASDGDGFLAIWSNGAGDGLFSTRISRDGTVLDPFGIFLPGVKGVSLIWAGDRYLDIWNENDNIVAAELGTDGRVLAAPRVVQSNIHFSGVASNGKVTLLLTFEGEPTGYSNPDSNGYLVLDGDLNIIASEADPASAAFPSSGPFVTGSGEFLITGYYNTARLDSSGRLVAKTPHGWLYDIVCRKTECITAFDNNQTYRFAIGSYDPVTMVNGPPHDLPETFLNQGYWLAATDAGYFYITGSNTAWPLDPEGRLLGSSTVLPGAGYVEHTASNGPGLALLKNSQDVITAMILTPTGVTQPAALAFSANSQYDIAMARGSSNYLAVWVEKGGTYAGRLSLDGQPLDGRGTLLGALTGRASVIFNGSSYLVALRKETNGTDYANRQTPQSTVQIDPTTGAVAFVSNVGGTDLRIASNGSTPVATWNDHGNLMAAFLSANGSVASAPVLVAAAPPNTNLRDASVGWNGSAWLVAWEEDPNPPPPEGDPPTSYPPVFPAIRGARLSPALTPLDTQPVTIAPPVSRSDPFTQLTRVASDGKDFLVAWSDGGLYSSPSDVHIRRVPATGAPAEPEMLLFAGTLHDLVWDGQSYNLAFKSQGTTGSLAVARLRASGLPFETLAISGPAAGGSASLIPIGNGSILAAYTRVALPFYSGSERAFVATPYPARGHAVRRALP